MPEAQPSEPGAVAPIPRRTWIVMAVVVVASLAGGTYGYRIYDAYAARWLRPVAKVPACAISIRPALRRPTHISGTEPHESASGTTVHLTKAEDLAVRCIKGAAGEPAVGRRLATAFGELEPDARARELLKLLKETVPPDPGRDREAAAVYYVASAALEGLPDSPAVKAAREEVERLHACRFRVKAYCPDRPDMPFAVYVFGVPSAIALLTVVLALAGEGVKRVAARRRKATG